LHLNRERPIQWSLHPGPFDNPNVEVFDTGRYGLGVRTLVGLKPGERVAVFDGPIYTAETCSDLPCQAPKLVRDHAIQFAKHRWRDAFGIARYVCHSCDPNCGISGLFNVVTRRNVAAGEEITFDYDMTENCDWSMYCRCKSRNCRKWIRGYRFLPIDVIEGYGSYISAWLR